MNREIFTTPSAQDVPIEPSDAREIEMHESVRGIRNLIREMILEDAEGFKARTSSINYDDMSAEYRGEPVAPKSIPREVKAAWNQEADHAFFDSLTKVHWIQGRPGDMWNVADNMREFIKANRKDEVSVMGYSGNPKPSRWGDFGVMVQGRTTLAARNMNSIFSGYYKSLDPQAVKSYRKTSGIPRRAKVFGPETSGAFMFNEQDFGEEGPGNELIVDNWRPVGLVGPQWFFDSMEKDMKKFNKVKLKPEHWHLMNLFLKTKELTGLDLPIYSTSGKLIDMAPVRAMRTTL